MDLADLHAISETERSARKSVRIRCCTAAGCLSSGSENVKERLDEFVQRAGMSDRVQVCAVGCMRLCCEGPLVQVDPQGSLYQRVKPEEASSIVGALDGGPEAAA